MRVLVFEPNNHHFEILPGFCKLFEKLGYKVDLLVRDHTAFGDEFCRAQISVRVFHYENDGYVALGARLKEEKYNFVFISSYDHIDNGKLVNSVKRIEEVNLKIPYIGCFHDLSNIGQFENIDLLKKGRIVTLSEYKYNGTDIPMVNPQYFNEIVERYHKNNVTSFVMVGTNIWRQY